MPAKDNFRDLAMQNLPFRNAVNVIPSDTQELEEVSRAIYIATQGDLSVVMMDGATVVLGDLAPGALHPIRVRRVNVSGTTATGILAFV